MKFIGRVSTVNLADISPGGETKVGTRHLRRPSRWWPPRFCHLSQRSFIRS